MNAPAAPTVSTTDLPKSYTPSEAQAVVVKRWDEARAFHAVAGPSGGEQAARPPFSILIPPPNVTAALHLGHAFNNTLQDILTRWHRMRGFNTLWMPGTDHAGIATQTVVDKRLQTQGQPSLKDYKRLEDQGKAGREQFVAKVQSWKDEYEATIIAQLKAIGCSCDFERTRFTMDEICAKAVREAFFRLFKEGLIYRGKRLVNWDPASQTALADDEVEMEEVQGHMHYLRYPLVEETPTTGNTETPKWVTVATTRPETMLGDTAVAMNPKDPRAAQLVGRKVRLPIVGRVIPIIADDYVVMPASMGGDASDPKAAIATGFLKVTPAHDDNDYQIGQRHPEIGMVNVFAPDASISDKHGWTDVSDESRQFIGLSREEARKRIVAWFKSHTLDGRPDGPPLLEDVKPYTHSVGHSYRSHVPIEPYLSDQWYVKVTDDRMRGEALRAMAPDQAEGAAVNPGGRCRTPLPPDQSNPHPGDGELRFFPARYAKTFQTWHENIRDWCISRQIWWGHRIPVWTKELAAIPDEIDSPANVWVELTQSMSAKLDAMCEGTHDFISRQQLEDLGFAVRDVRNLDLRKAIRYACAPANINADVINRIESKYFTQDPDVLDTWFSSALWPISTMGWPEPEAFPKEIPEGSALLETFNPSTVLFTAREIITLWVSRMVMFNRHFRDGKLPFKDVYIHAMIQDGHGQKMSKSLGNGVDPRDIVHGHGADALRFIMASIATHTQDVRLSVDMVCPHCSETFHPKEITSPAGYRVAAPEQECPKCRKKMVSGYGAATGLATPSDAMPLARNTSSKFDEGRNFANKLWNATRFALGNLGGEAKGSSGQDAPTTGLPLVDRWILARLARTLNSVDEALAGYQFKDYADAAYDFVWRDFCDWHLEAIKPTVKSNPAQQRVLAAVLDAIMRMLHPIMPFVTEILHPHIQAASAGMGEPLVEGVSLRRSGSGLVITAPWPRIDPSLNDAQAVATFERVQALVNAIRTCRAERQTPPKKKIRLAAPEGVIELIGRAGGVVETMAMLESVDVLTPESRPMGAIPLPFEGQEVLLSGLVEAMDAGAERARLSKVVSEKQRAVSGFEAKLGNPGYLSKAPPDKVEETRRLLAQAQADLAAAAGALQSLETAGR